MNKSQRIWLGSGNTGNDKYIQVKLEQDVDTLEVMSLKIDTKEAYDSFNADYGVIVGRVNANQNVGIENVKISIFIPLQEEDENNSEIVGIYPYKNPRDKNSNGKRYNLLPRVATRNPNTGEISPKQPFGSFPTKEEFVTNPTFLEVYKKYYKYTTVTNQSGDYMIYGVPTGTQTVHMSVDITDIKTNSMTPASMIKNLGYSPNLFTENGTRIKRSNDLDDLPNIETQEVSVDVIPFWGDSNNFDIGITRLDFRIRAQVSPTFVIFGSAFTDGEGSMWGEFFNGERRGRNTYRASDNGDNTIAIATKRIGIIEENIYYYPPRITDEDLQDLSSIDINTDILKLDTTEYSAYKRDGDFAFIVSCNRKKLITTETGEQEEVDYTFPGGIFTEFKGFVTLEINEDSVNMDFSSSDRDVTVRPFRYRLKIPQSIHRGGGIGDDVNREGQNRAWSKKFATFSGNSLYSVAKFHGTVYNNTSDDDTWLNSNRTADFFNSDRINEPYNRDPFWNTGIIQTGDLDGFTGNTAMDFPANSSTDSGRRLLFGANWLNFSVYLPQVGYFTGKVDKMGNMRSSSNYAIDTKNDRMYIDNIYPIAAGDTNTKDFARNDLHFTDFITAPKEFLISLAQEVASRKGFTSLELPQSLKNEIDTNDKIKFLNGNVPVSKLPNYNGSVMGGGGKILGNPAGGVDTNYYFFKGLKSADCLDFIQRLGLLE